MQIKQAKHIDQIKQVKNKTTGQIREGGIWGVRGEEGLEQPHKPQNTHHTSASGKPHLRNDLDTRVRELSRSRAGVRAPAVTTTLGTATGAATGATARAAARATARARGRARGGRGRRRRTVGGDRHGDLGRGVDQRRGLGLGGRGLGLL